MADSEGLRERKKRLTRQHISDTATGMFLERGFDEVKVSDVAAACDVSEKTVYNYFPTKESLLLDREEKWATDIRTALGPASADRSPIDALVRLIGAELGEMYEHIEASRRVVDMTMVRRFAELVEQTPSLRAAQMELMDRLVGIAADAMAARAGMDPTAPEPQIAATALVGLWRVQFAAMRRHAESGRAPSEVHALVMDEVRRAARLIDTGLWSFGLAVQGTNGREQLKAAAEAANDARRQVITAMRQARSAWRQVVAESHHGDGGGHRGHHGPSRTRR